MFIIKVEDKYGCISGSRLSIVPKLTMGCAQPKKTWEKWKTIDKRLMDGKIVEWKP